MGKRIIDKYAKSIADVEKAKTLSAEEQVKLGIKYFRNSSAYKNPHIALEIFLMAAKQNNIQAMMYVAKIYLQGLNGTPNIAQGVKYLKKASEFGNLNAMCMLGQIARNGLCEEFTPEDCVKYYTKAADLGSLYAKFCLADIYKTGHPVAKDIQKAIRYYSFCIVAPVISKNIGILAESYFGLVQCYLELHYLEEANTTRDATYYNASKKNKEQAKQYLKEATKLRDLISQNMKERFEESLRVYLSILNEDEIDLSKMNYVEFFKNYFNKHPRIFLSTKKSESSIYSEGIMSYFLKRDASKDEIKRSIKKQEKSIAKRKTVLKNIISNLNLTTPEEEINTITEGALKELDDELNKFKESYLVDYSSCVVNLDKYLEEILHQIFVVEMHKQKQQNLNCEIEAQSSLILKLINKLSLEKLQKFNNLANNISLGVSISKINQEKHVQILNSFVKKMIEGKTPRSTDKKLENLKQYQNSETTKDCDELELIENIINLNSKVFNYHNLKINQNFQLGSLFDLTFVDRTTDESIKLPTTNKLKEEILTFVQSINTNLNKNEIYLKLHELILKIECFRVMIRNVASHKSILTQSAIERGLNLCIVQQNSIFNLLDELFGEYLESQMYLKDFEKFNQKLNAEIPKQTIEALVYQTMEEVENRTLKI